jgi:methionyl-tRNA formyltransferase
VSGATDARVRTVFIGTGTFAVPALRVLASAPEVHLVGVVTAPPRPAGRRQDLRPSPVAAAAGELALAPVLAPARLRRPDGLEAVLGLSPALIVLADYGQIVPPPLLDLPHGALNLHPSLLPRHRGAAPVPATILAGDEETGVALMRMDAGLDTGPLIAVEAVDLRGDETTPDLEARLAELGAGLLGRSLGPWLRNELEAVPQAVAGATLTRPLRREDGRLDPSRPAEELERQVRAFRPWPGAWLETDAGRIAVVAARVARDRGISAGRIAVVGRRLVLGTADAALEILELQPAAGRAMDAAAFVRGRPSFAAEVVPGPPREPIERPVGSSTAA